MHKKIKQNSRPLTRTTVYYQQGGTFDWMSGLKALMGSMGGSTSPTNALGLEGADKARSMNNAIGGLSDSFAPGTMGAQNGASMLSASAPSLPSFGNSMPSAGMPQQDPGLTSQLAATLPSKAKQSGGIGMSNIASGLTAASGDITNMLSIGSNPNLNVDQKQMKTADSAVNGIADAAAAFGPWGMAAGAALKIINGVGGSLMGTPKEMKNYKTNDQVASSSGYTGVAAEGADIGSTDTTYAGSGLAGKLFGNKGKLVDRTKADEAIQTQTASLLNKGKLDMDSSAAATGMFDTRLNMKNNDGSMWTNGSVTSGREGMKVKKAQDGASLQIPNSLVPSVGTTKDFMSGYGTGYGSALQYFNNDPFSKFLNSQNQAPTRQSSPGFEESKWMTESNNRDVGYLNDDNVDFLKGQKASIDGLLQSQPAEGQQKPVNYRAIMPKLTSYKIPTAKEGGSTDDINIKKSHEGKFTDYKKRTGESTSEALHSSDPHVRKMAQFAANAKKWKHQQGGVMQQDDVKTTLPPPRPPYLSKPLPNDGITQQQRATLSGNPHADYPVVDYDNMTMDHDTKQDSIAKSYTGAPMFTIKDTKYNMRNNEQVNSKMLSDLVTAAVRSKVDPYLAVAIAQRESGLGMSDTPQQGKVDLNKEPGGLDPYKLFSNWSQDNEGLNAEEKAKMKSQISTSETIPYNTFNKISNFYKQASAYPFADEMNTINQKTKNGTFIRGYNYGDPDYENKINKEKEILLSPENSAIKNYIDKIAAGVQQHAQGGIVKPDHVGPKFNPVNQITHDLITNFMFPNKMPHKREDGGSISISGSSQTKTATKFNYEDGGEIQDKWKKLVTASLKLPLKQFQVRPLPVTTDVPTSPENSQPLVFKEGGAINVILDGALHARKHDLKDHPDYEDAAITHKGIPVITKTEDGEVEQHAEVEKDELILHLDVSKRLEELLAEGTDEAAIEAGKLLAGEIVNNTKDSESKIIENA
jgi:hypothetical protein